MFKPTNETDVRHTEMRQNAHYEKYYVFWSKIVFMEMIPYCTIIILNVIIVWKIVKSSKFRRNFTRRSQLQNGSQSQAKPLKKQSTTTSRKMNDQQQQQQQHPQPRFDVEVSVNGLDSPSTKAAAKPLSQLMKESSEGCYVTTVSSAASSPTQNTSITTAFSSTFSSVKSGVKPFNNGHELQQLTKEHMISTTLQKLSASEKRKRVSERVQTYT